MPSNLLYRLEKRAAFSGEEFSRSSLRLIKSCAWLISAGSVPAASWTVAFAALIKA